MEYCKVQLGCLFIVLYIAFIYIRACKLYKKKLSSSMFDELLYLGIITILLDGTTAITVNHLDTVDIVVNRILHMLFLISLDTVVYALFGYMLKVTGTMPKSKAVRIILHIPYLISVLTVMVNIRTLEFRIGETTNYSMGVYDFYRGSIYSSLALHRTE